MAKGFAIHNAPTDHGGIIPATQMRGSQMGNLFIRAGDGHFCPKCQCWSTVIKSHDHILFDNKAVAYVGDKLTCGAKILPQQSHVVGDRRGVNVVAQSSARSNSAYSDQKNNFIDNSIKKYVIQLKDIARMLFVPFGAQNLNNPNGKPYDKVMEIHGGVIVGNYEKITFEVKKDEKYIEIGHLEGLFTANKGFKFEWDGFVDDIYDSKFFTNPKGVEFKIKGFNGGNEMCLDEKAFQFKYFKKDWIDVRINRKLNQIYIKLRVNLVDGGATGLDTSWRRVPKSVIKSNQPLQQRTLTFNELKKIAIESMNYHWSRNNKNPYAKNIFINGKRYEVTVNCIESSSMSMPAMSLIFASNWKASRSCNWEISRVTYYNTGYIEFQTFSGNPNDSDWEFWDKVFSDKKFKYVFAHEMGHEILLAYGGQKYSKMHINTSSLITQSPKEGTAYPQSGEIDLMKYAKGNARNVPLFFERSVAAKEDVASLLIISGITKK